MIAVHLVHVLAMAVIVGGATAGGLGGGSRRLEALLWGGLGAVVVTGVGNVGRYGDGLPPASTFWGAMLLAKLALVLVLLGASVRRSAAVWTGSSAVWAYRMTAGVGFTIAAVGVWLAHG